MWWGRMGRGCLTIIFIPHYHTIIHPTTHPTSTFFVLHCTVQPSCLVHTYHHSLDIEMNWEACQPNPFLRNLELQKEKLPLSGPWRTLKCCSGLRSMPARILPTLPSEKAIVVVASSVVGNRPFSMSCATVLWLLNAGKTIPGML